MNNRRNKGKKPNKNMVNKVTKQIKWNQGKLNDISWYNQNPMLMKIAGLVNFLYRVGSSISSLWESKPNFGKWDYIGSGDGVLVPSRIPGVMRLGWLPVPGVVKNPQDAINAALDKLFEDLRLKNFSVSVYDAADVGFYLLSCDSILSFFAYLTLIYNHAKKHSFVNSYLPKAILSALNVDYDDVVAKLDQLLFRINVYAEKIQVLKVPKAINYIARHMHMSAQIYRDADNEKSQLYVFVPDYVWKYNATRPALEPMPVGKNAAKLKVNDLFNIMDQLLDAILPDEDMQIIAADIVKYYSGDVWTVNNLDWDSNLDPVFNKEMLWQIHNADFCPYSSVSNLEITQITTGNLNTIIHFDPTFNGTEAGVTLKRIIDSDSEAPDAAEVIESTRLKFTVTDFSQSARNAVSFKLKSCGSEIITNALLVMFKDDATLLEKEVTTFVQYNTNQGSQEMSFPYSGDNSCQAGSDFFSILIMATFDYRPITYLVGQFGTAPNLTNVFSGILAPLTNYAIIDDDQLDALNEQSLLSEFNLAGR